MTEEQECWRAEVRYKGTDFCGWQKQPAPNSVQQYLEDALSRLFKGQKMSIAGSGRTDAGVHALAQVFSFRSPRRYDAASLQKAINGIVPRDISVRYLRKAEDDFHARFSARGKTYMYLIDNSFFANPLLRDYSWHVAKKLDVAMMRQGLVVLTGEHDFASFTAKLSEKEGACTVRCIERFEIEEVSENLLAITVTGNGFLYKMVRSLVGQLVDLGLGRLDLTELQRILEAKCRTQSAATAPAQGLYLAEVYYSDEERKKGMNHSGTYYYQELFRGGYRR